MPPKRTCGARGSSSRALAIEADTLPAELHSLDQGEEVTCPNNYTNGTFLISDQSALFYISLMHGGESR